MTRPDPLGKRLASTGAVLTPFSAPMLHHTATSGDGAETPLEQSGIEIVDSFGDPQAELTALRRSCAILDLPQQGVICASGADRLDFLDRMLTQRLANLKPNEMQRAFLLTRQGRLLADFRVASLSDRILLDLHRQSAPGAIETLEKHIIADDVTLLDLSDTHHRMALHGPRSLDLIASMGTMLSGEPVKHLTQGDCCAVEIAGAEVVVMREDSTGKIGLELMTKSDDALSVYEALTTTGDSDESRARPIGWRAFNMARLCAGSPIFGLDFGVESLPDETGVLLDRVCFDKGCYPGQEIVARMQSRGASRRRLVAMRLSQCSAPAPGSIVRAPDGETMKEVGVVTSSADIEAPGAEQSGESFCFASVKTRWSAPGEQLLMDTDDASITGVVLEGLSCA